MKYVVTHLKAPWPAGVVVGSVLELDAVPEWAVGKCEPAADDAEVTAGLPQPEAAADPQPEAQPEAAAEKPAKAKK